MAKLIYMVNVSLDGYTEDPAGGFDWGDPDEEYFTLINDIQRSIGTYLYGRRMYETMVYWETAPLDDLSPWVAEFADMWRAADKVVFSKTLAAASSDRTVVERELDVEAIERMKTDATHDLTVGGADLAAQAFAAGLVDECHVFLWPLVVGGGKHTLPTQERYNLHLLNERHTSSGVVQLRYRVSR